jgi:transcription elongation factor
MHHVTKKNMWQVRN